MTTMQIFEAVAAGKMTPEQGAELMMRDRVRWYTGLGTRLLGLLVRALLAAVRAISRLFGPKEKRP